MVVLTHGPETCAAFIPEIRRKQLYAVENLENTSKKHKIRVQGVWVDSPAHLTYMLMDAPDAHEINSLVMELRLPEWNTVEVRPILPLTEMMELLKKMNL
jgi:muconolactone delta-isomerase